MDIEKIKKWQIEQLKKYGFYIHYVPLNDNMANIHTHGIQEMFHHLDFQIVLPIHPKIAKGIFHTLVQEIKNGKRFEEEGFYLNIIQNYPVFLVKRTELGREVMRIVLPDEQGKFYEKVEEGNIYSYQLEKDIDI